jgi:RsiW-degrading membrane proteinase PrsW (M82 family)
MPPIFQSAGLIVLGLLPSLIWLVFYYREDCHPGPKHLLARTFLTGIIIAPLAVVFQLGFIKIAEFVDPLSKSYITQSVGFFLWAAFIEEFVKFYATYIAIIKKPGLHEPMDAIMYLITAALGFAAIENILILFQVLPGGTGSAVSTLILRFIGATLLHALTSGILGYFLAVSWFKQHHAKKLIFVGLIVATLFHFAFNIIISSIDNPALALFYSTLLLLAMSLLISVLFDKTKHRAQQLTANLTGN